MIATPAFRRFSRVTLLLFAGSIAAAPAVAKESIYDAINESAAQSEVTTTPLRGGVSLLVGSGGNIGVLSGPDGALMVDAGIAISKAKIGAALQSVGAIKVRYVVNTHWHWDHADGDAWLHAGGATVVASPATAKHLGQTIRVEEWDHSFTPVAAGGRPTMLIATDRTLSLNDETVEIHPYMASHTDGDLLVQFKKADVIFTGDIYWNGLYPFIDHYERGSIDGTIQAVEWTLEMAGPNTIIVPGHGPSGTRADLIEYRDMLVAIRDRVATLKREGKTLDEVLASHPTDAFDAKWGKGIVSSTVFISLVYRGV